MPVYAQGPEDREALKGKPQPTLRNWLPAFPRRIVPWPSLMSADSSLKISLRNLFWEEWTRLRISVLITSRFFSKKPVGKAEPAHRPSSASL